MVDNTTSPFGNDLPPTILHMETVQTWSGRPAESRLHMVTREVAWRLKGLGDVIFGMGLRHRSDGGHNLDEYVFLGGTIKDLAIELERAHEHLWKSFEAESAAKLKASRKAATRPRKGGNGATRRRARS